MTDAPDIAVADESAGQGRYTEERITDLLRSHFPHNKGYVLVPQFRNGAAFNCDRTIDAIVISTWPSLGLYRTAIEIKVCRPDFLRELSEPAKMAWARDEFHFVWFAVAPDVALPQEIPDGVGLMEAHGKTLRTIIAARENKDATLKDDLLAVVASRTLDITEAEVARRVESLPEIKRLRALEKAVDRFMKQRGVHGYYGPPDTADAGYEALCTAAASSVGAAEAVKSCEVLEDLQGKIVALWEAVSLISVEGLTALDDAGQLLSEKYGTKAFGGITRAVKRFKQTKKKLRWARDNGLADALQALTLLKEDKAR